MMQSVQVIIERLKSHPEDFFGDKQSDRRTYQGTFPKFQDITEKLDDLLIDKQDAGHIHRLWYLEPEEKAALLEAYKEARRARFEANVFHTLLSKPEENYGASLAVRSHPMSGKIMMQGSSGPMWQGDVPEEEGQGQGQVYAKNRNPRP
jgi:hypothetical protein